MNRMQMEFIKRIESGELLAGKIDEETAVKEIYKLYFVEDRDEIEMFPSINPIVNEFYKLHKHQIIKTIMTNIVDEEKWDEIEKYVVVISEIFDSLMKEQGCEFTDIKVAGQGFFSTVFSIGEKILKIGESRATFNIRNHPRILQPLDREEFTDESGNPIACIEITEEVRKISILDFNINKLYEIYKELRLSGIVWADARLENLGILKHANLPKYNGEEYENNPEFVGMKGSIDKGNILQERRLCNFRYRFIV